MSVNKIWKVSCQNLMTVNFPTIRYTIIMASLSTIGFKLASTAFNACAYFIFTAKFNQRIQNLRGMPSDSLANACKVFTHHCSYANRVDLGFLKREAKPNSESQSSVSGAQPPEAIGYLIIEI